MSLISELLTQVKIEASQFHREMDKITKETSGFTSAFKVSQAAIAASAAVIATAIAGIGYTIISVADKIDDLGHSAEKLGVSFQAFQSLAYAANLADVEVTTLQSSFTRMSKTINDAAMGSKSAQQALASIGLEAKDLINLAPDQQFEKIAASIQDIQNTTQQKGAISDIFGKGGVENIALITSNIREAREEYESFNIALTQGQLEQTSVFGDTAKTVGTLFTGITQLVVSEVVPAFTDVLNVIKEIILGTGDLRSFARATANVILIVAEVMTAGLAAALIPVDALINGLKFILNIALAIKDAFVGLGSVLSGGKWTGVRDPFAIKPSTLSLSAAKVGQTIDNARQRMNASPITTNNNSSNNSQMFTGAYSPKDFTDSINTNVIALKSSESALKILNDKALEAAGTLDKFTKIRDALDAAGKKQTDDIIKNAVGNREDSLADADEFKESFTEALNAARSGDMSSIQSDIENLQRIIDDQTGDSNWVGNDVSGLVGALNELKAYLGSRANTQQQVQVKIKVDASEDFVTTITQSQTFKQAVEDEIANTNSRLARSELP